MHSAENVPSASPCPSPTLEHGPARRCMALWLCRLGSGGRAWLRVQVLAGHLSGHSHGRAGVAGTKPAAVACVRTPEPYFGVRRRRGVRVRIRCGLPVTSAWHLWCVRIGGGIFPLIAQFLKTSRGHISEVRHCSWVKNETVLKLTLYLYIKP